MKTKEKACRDICYSNNSTDSTDSLKSSARSHQCISFPVAGFNVTIAVTGVTMALSYYAITK